MTNMDHSAADVPNGANGERFAHDRRLTREEFERYSRQMIVPGVGREGELPSFRIIRSLNLHGY